MFSWTKRRNILARQLRGNKSSLLGYEMNKARDHQLYPKLANKDYEDLVPRFPNRSYDISNHSQWDYYILQRKISKARRTKVPEVHRNACVMKQLSGSCVIRFILLQNFEQGFMIKLH